MQHAALENEDVFDGLEHIVLGLEASFKPQGSLPPTYLAFCQDIATWVRARLGPNGGAVDNDKVLARLVRFGEAVGMHAPDLAALSKAHRAPTPPADPVVEPEVAAVVVQKKGKKRAAPEPVASDAEIEVEPERRVKKSKSGSAAKTSSKRATTNPAKSASNRHRREAYKTVQDSDVVLEGDDRVSRAESDRASTTDTSLVRVLPQELPRHVSSGLQSAAHRRLSPLQGPRAPL